MTDCVRITACRLCDSRDLDLIVSFTPTPPGDQYLATPKPQPCYPLDLLICRGCRAVQLADTVNPELIYPDYIYTTSISKGLHEHFDRYAASVLERVQPTRNLFVIDIGSNDGTLLKAFKKRGCLVAGVDPAEKIAIDAQLAGIPTFIGFLSKDFAETIRRTEGQADIVTANHIMANVADLHDFAEGVKTLLAPEGTFVFETGYWPAIRDRMLIDTIEHEHIHYFAVKPLARFFARHGLRLDAVEAQPTKGGSLRGYVRHAASTVVDETDDSVACFIAREYKAAEVLTVPPWTVEKPAQERWVGYGAAVGSTLLLHHYGLGTVLSELWDDNANRHGWYSPGFHLPVVPPNHSPADRIVILAWRYADRIMAAHPEHAGKWIIPLPTWRVA